MIMRERFTFIYESVRCRDKASGKTEEFPVTDYVSSAVTGDGYFVLGDEKGRTKQVTREEFDEIRIR